MVKYTTAPLSVAFNMGFANGREPSNSDITKSLKKKKINGITSNFSRLYEQGGKDVGSDVQVTHT